MLAFSDPHLRFMSHFHPVLTGRVRTGLQRSVGVPKPRLRAGPLPSSACPGGESSRLSLLSRAFPSPRSLRCWSVGLDSGLSPWLPGATLSRLLSCPWWGHLPVSALRLGRHRACCRGPNNSSALARPGFRADKAGILPPFLPGPLLPALLWAEKLCARDANSQHSYWKVGGAVCTWGLTCPHGSRHLPCPLSPGLCPVSSGISETSRCASGRSAPCPQGRLPCRLSLFSATLYATSGVT